MHKDDQMTPKERAFALFAKKPVDRMPIKLFSPYIGMNFGATYEEAFVQAKSRAHWLIESYRRFGQDGLSVNYRIDGIPVAFGAESTYDPTGIPIVKNAVLKSLSDVSQLSLENVEFKNDINAQIAFDAVRYVQDELADEVFTGVGLMGPFDNCCQSCRYRSRTESHEKRSGKPTQITGLRCRCNHRGRKKVCRKSDGNRPCGTYCILAFSKAVPRICYSVLQESDGHMEVLGKPWIRIPYLR